MSDKLFAAGGMDAPQMVGKPAAMRSGATAGGVNGIPGTTMVTSFEEAKEFARNTDVTGTTKAYTPLDRPGRMAERLNTPTAPSGMGIKTL